MIRNFLKLIRFSHTVFALPFAAGSMVVASNGFPPWRIALLILACMVFARTCAMLFNRWADWEWDKRNPRTSGRHLLAQRPALLVGTVIAGIGFLVSAALLNRWCAWLAPVALAVILVYSMTKRFTALCHFVLGLALAIAPVGAWLAVCGEWAWAPVILAAGVLLWVAGFDLIYATQDVKFDREAGLRSLVVVLGVPNALRMALALHWGMLLMLVAFGLAASLGTAYYAGVGAAAFCLAYEHTTIRRGRVGDLSAVNRAFFWSNAVLGCIFVVAVVADRFYRAGVALLGGL
jgi:4-hydroxybenzoate polyprenyltransferase